MKTGEDSVTSSESSSVMWECITELSMDRNEVSTQISIDSG